MNRITERPRSSSLGAMAFILLLFCSESLRLHGSERAGIEIFKPLVTPSQPSLTSVETTGFETTGTASLDKSIGLSGYSIDFSEPGHLDRWEDCDLCPPQDPACSDGSDCYYWQWLPDGLMFKSYLAGVKEPRFGVIWANLDGRPEEIGGRGNIWEAALGGRVGILRYGTGDVVKPQGFQLDLEGAVFPRLDMDSKQDVIAMDFRFGAPFTFRQGGTSYKFGYYHISSHLGDEFMISYPFYVRDNYVREALFVGISHEPNDYLRFYGEAAYAVFDGGIVEPWEFKFGAEYSAQAATGVYSSPFAAVHCHLREELNFSGFVNIQAGWQWRGPSSDRLWRIGVHYFNGAVSQHALGRGNEELLGFGMWFDY